MLSDTSTPRRIGRLALAVVLVLVHCLALGACAPEEVPESPCDADTMICPLTPPLVSEGPLLIDHFGRRVLLRGVNVAQNWKLLETPFGDHTSQDFQRWRELGFNVVRMLTAWGHIMPTEDVIDGTYLSGLQERAQWADAAGLNIILDMHQDLYGYGFKADGLSIGNGAPEWSCPQAEYLKLDEPRHPWPMNHLNPGVVACYDYFWDHEERLEQYSAAFASAVEALSDVPALVGVDLLNEPSWGSFDRLSDYEWLQLLPLYERMIPAVRAHRSDLVHFMEPGAVKNMSGRTTLPKPGYGNIVYTPHFYDSGLELGGEYDPATEFYGSQILVDTEQAAQYDTPLLFGEWGMPNEIGPSKGQFVQDLTSLFDAHVAHWTVWESGPSGDQTGFFPMYGILNEDRSEADWVGSIARPYPSVWPHEALAFSFDPAARELRLQSQGLLGGAVPIGEIVLPYWIGGYEWLESAGIGGERREADRLYLQLEADRPVDLVLRFTD